MAYSQEIQNQIDDVKYWFEAEMRNGVDDRVKIGICREIVKCTAFSPIPKIKIAILSLVSADKIANPLKLTDDDIQNALWLVRDLRLGFKEDAPLVAKYLYK